MAKCFLTHYGNTEEGMCTFQKVGENFIKKLFEMGSASCVSVLILPTMYTAFPRK